MAQQEVSSGLGQREAKAPEGERVLGQAMGPALGAHARQLSWTLVWKLFYKLSR